MNKIILIFLLLSIPLFAQNLHQRFDGINFTINGVTPLNPFNGGLEVPRFQFTDIDGDNDLDLFIFDKDTSLNFYKNLGSVSSPFFVMYSKRFENLNIKNWFQFVDIDNDNDKDLFCGGDSQHVRYYKNIGTPVNAQFSFQSYALRTNLNEIIISEAACVPSFADMDSDGDIDFFSGASVGKITHYENIGSPSAFNFRFATEFWKGIEIIGGADYQRHGASAITFADIDADNDKDLYWGDLFGHSIYQIKNTGTAQNFNWNSIDTFSPPPVPYISGGFNMPGIFDIDNDGRNDFFIGVLLGSQSLDNFIYYKNNGPANNPSFSKITDNFIPSVDVGSYSYPAVGDIDNDGDPDLFIGCEKSVAFFRNTGSTTAPAYTMETDSLPLNIQSSIFNFSLTIGDLDGDGKKDLVLGYYPLAKLRFYKNTGSVLNPVFTYQSTQLDTFNLSQNSAPCLSDLDNDGDLDILAGNSSGKLFYYRNNGNQAVFNYQLISNNYMGISVGNDAAPSLGDLDNDGDLDLLVGNRAGIVYQYRNDGTVSSPNFTLVTNNFLGINTYQNSVPCIVDINTDGDKDMLLGNTKGGLFYFENRDVFGIQHIGSEIPSSFLLEQNFPNPFNPVTNFKFSIAKPGKVYLLVYDALGRLVETLIEGSMMPGNYKAEWNAAKYTSGVYFYRLNAGDYSETRKMILVK